MATRKTAAESQPEAALVEFFERKGYMRVPDDDRREEEPQGYKKGYEIRLVAMTHRELRLIRRLLRQVGLKGGKPFQKVNRWIQPIYGLESMERFEEWIKDFS